LLCSCSSTGSGSPARTSTGWRPAAPDERRRFLLGYAERFAGDRDSAEDAVQETFLRAWRNLPRILDDDRPVRAWLLRAIRRLLIDAARAAAVRPMSVAEDALPEPAVDGGFDRVLDSWVLTDALGRLTPEHRHALVEVIYRGTPAHLIAARLGVPPSTVRSRVHYARRELSWLLHIPDDPLEISLGGALIVHAPDVNQAVEIADYRTLPDFAGASRPATQIT